MKQLRNAKIATLIFHGFIFIVAGHGMALVGIGDVLFPYLVLKGELHFNSFESLMPWAVLSSFLGKSIVLISLFVTYKLWKHWLTIVGLILLLFSFTSIIVSTEASLTMLSLLSGIPFLLYAGRVFYLMYCSKKTE